MPTIVKKMFLRFPGLIWLSIFCFLVSCSHSNKLMEAGSSVNSIRVLTYNIHHANPPSKPGLIDIDAIVGVIKKANPDVVALQEIDVHTGRSGKELNEAEAIAIRTGMKFYFAKAIDYDGGAYGVAILSKYPMSESQKFPLPTLETTKGEPRVLATALLDLPGNKRIRFACTHLDAQRADTNRVLQIEKIAQLLNNEALPIILAGDLNAVPESRVINKLDQYFNRSCTGNCGFTIPETNPTKTIDFVAFSKGKFSVKEHEVVAESYASDHRPVLAVLNY